MGKIRIVLFSLYLLTVLYTVFIAGNDHRDLHFFAFDKGVNLIPFKEKVGLIVNHYFMYRNDYIYFAKEIIGNLLLLFPLPFFLAGGNLFPTFHRVAILCLVISTSIELLQFLSNTGQADIDDIILNTIGGLLGFYVANRLRNKRLFSKYRLL